MSYAAVLISVLQSDAAPAIRLLIAAGVLKKAADEPFAVGDHRVAELNSICCWILDLIAVRANIPGLHNARRRILPHWQPKALRSGGRRTERMSYPVLSDKRALDRPLFRSGYSRSMVWLSSILMPLLAACLVVLADGGGFSRMGRPWLGFALLFLVPSGIAGLTLPFLGIARFIRFLGGLCLVCLAIDCLCWMLLGSALPPVLRHGIVTAPAGALVYYRICRRLTAAMVGSIAGCLGLASLLLVSHFVAGYPAFGSGHLVFSLGRRRLEVDGLTLLLGIGPIMGTIASLPILLWPRYLGVPVFYVPGHCPCGYNLTGNTSGCCPECGRRIQDESDSSVGSTQRG